MSQKRMFSLKVIDTDAFLDMPPTTQNLYFHLGMRADDDGFVANPKKIMKIINSAEDDMKVLVSKQFVFPFESGVCVIKHWRIHNLIRQDRYTETEYKQEKQTLLIEDNKYVIPNGNQMPTTGVHRLGKDRLGKVKKEEDSIPKKFSFSLTLNQLKDSSNKVDNIIALYWRKKRWKFENKEQYQSAYKRDMMLARPLVGYTGRQLVKVMNYCQETFEDNWSLSAVAKQAPNVINKKST